MKKKLRRQLKDYYQIGNYIFVNSQGKVAVVIPRNERITNSKIRNDFHTLIEFYGIDIANYYIKCCSEYLENKR